VATRTPSGYAKSVRVNLILGGVRDDMSRSCPNIGDGVHDIEARRASMMHSEYRITGFKKRLH
jgi:hypothetical protein